MTSKHSLWTRWVQQNKRFTWLYVINSIALLFFGPLRLIYILTEPMQDKKDLFYNARFVQGYNRKFCCLFVLLAVLAGVFIFSYLHSRKKIDFYHSQPASEKNRFFNLYSSGLLCNYIPCIITFLLNLIITKCFGVLTFDLFQQALATVMIYMLAYFAAYQIAVLMTIITGNILYTVPLTGIAFIYEIVFRELITEFCEQFFQNYCYYTTADTHQCKWSSVCILLQKTATISSVRSSKEMWEIAGNSCIYVAILSVLAGLVACFAYIKRPTEYSGPSLAFNWIKPVIKILSTILATLFVIDLFYAEGLWSDLAVGIISVFIVVFIFIILSSCVCHIVFEFIWELDIRAVKKHFRSTLIATGFTLLFFCGFYFDLFGYDTYVPNTNSVESVGVVMETYYSDIYYHKEFLDDMELHCVEEACEAAKELCKDNSDNDFYEDVICDVEWLDTNILPIYFAFHMKDGSTCYRTYELNLKDGDIPLSSIINSKEYKKATYPLVYDDDYMEQLKPGKNADFFWIDRTSTGEELNFKNKQQIKELQKALKADCEEHFEITPFVSQDKHTAIGILSIGDAEYGSTEKTSSYLIFPEYTRTITCLKEMGITIDMETGFDLEEISSINLYCWDDTDTKKKIENPEQIKELLALALNHWQYTGNNLSTYEIKLSDSYGDTFHYPLRNPLPDWVAELFEE